MLTGKEKAITLQTLDKLHGKEKSEYKLFLLSWTIKYIEKIEVNNHPNYDSLHKNEKGE